jgi:hypothetical protein
MKGGAWGRFSRVCQGEDGGVVKVRRGACGFFGVVECRQVRVEFLFTRKSARRGGARQGVRLEAVGAVRPPWSVDRMGGRDEMECIRAGLFYRIPRRK